MRLLSLVIAATSILALLTGCAGPSAIRSAHSITAYTVSPESNSSTKGIRRSHGYPIRTGPISVHGSDAIQLAQLMADVYLIDWPNLRCTFQPRYALVFRSSFRTIDALICPGCEEVRFYQGIGDIRKAYLGRHSNDVVALLQRISGRGNDRRRSR
jgi:hypothetical protein